jgi:hypothetical protein
MRSFVTVDFNGTKQQKQVVLRKDGEMYLEWDVRGDSFRGLRIHQQLLDGTVIKIDNLDNLVTVPVADIATKVSELNPPVCADPWRHVG